jgi:hypothetical protein
MRTKILAAILRVSTLLVEALAGVKEIDIST